ncbi:MAG: hypothetical protein QMD71_07575 [bacterium]|nr:hypothetical protein [bacterium]
MIIEVNLLRVTFLLYLMADIFYFINSFRPKKILWKTTFSLACIGFLTHTSYLALRGYYSQHLPFATKFEATVFLHGQ